MFNLLWKTGVQMIIFLAGLQAISPALFEASSIEGASAWENFFMITIPMLSPIILVNTVYTVVDSFIDSSNSVMNQVMANSSSLRLNWAATMSWTYFLLVGVVLAVVMGVFAKINKKLS
jgi:ABC-type sugar transport system permease subunit